MLGYQVVNGNRELTGHALSVAAVVIARFADNIQGNRATVVPRGGLKLKGNMAGAAIQIAAGPSGKVNAIHQFPGQQRQLSWQAMLSPDAEKIILGIVPFGKGDS
jgi:hypothetical protein